MAKETIRIDEIRGRLLYATALQKTNKEQLALEEYRDVLKLEPLNGLAHKSLANIYLAQKDLHLAELHFLKYIESEPQNPNAYHSLGEYYMEIGLADSAIIYYKKSILIDAKFSESRFELAKVFESQSMEKEAINNLEILLELTPYHKRAKEAKKLLEKLKK